MKFLKEIKYSIRIILRICFVSRMKIFVAAVCLVLGLVICSMAESNIQISEASESNDEEVKILS
jgi:hypothetical protein